MDAVEKVRLQGSFASQPRRQRRRQRLRRKTHLQGSFRAVSTRPSLSLEPWIGAESDEAESDEAASDEAASDEAESEACCEQVLPNKYISELAAKQVHL